MTTRQFEIRNQNGQGEVKAIVTIECAMLADAEQHLVALNCPTLDVPPEREAIFFLRIGPGYDRQEVKA